MERPSYAMYVWLLSGIADMYGSDAEVPRRVRQNVILYGIQRGRHMKQLGSRWVSPHYRKR